MLRFIHNQVDGVQISTMFFGVDLAMPDKTYILPIISGVTQMILSLMILPGAESHDLVPNNSKKKKIIEANKKEEGTMEMAETMQKQMIFVLPVVTTVAALQFPSGLVMYWVATTVFAIVQQWIVSGPGGLTLYLNKVINKLMPKKETV
jgi:membrane protein insertase Oxa1/YidC/SpoIIIJ